MGLDTSLMKQHMDGQLDSADFPRNAAQFCLSVILFADKSIRDLETISLI